MYVIKYILKTLSNDFKLQGREETEPYINYTWGKKFANYASCMPNQVWGFVCEFDTYILIISQAS